MSVHQGAVRCLTVLPSTDALISGSIDTSCKMFNIDKSNGKYAFEREFTYHDSFILAVHPNISNNGFYTSSKDRKIMHVDANGNPHMLFEGHENSVNSLS
jgi:WD40 repeat protein